MRTGSSMLKSLFGIKRKLAIILCMSLILGTVMLSGCGNETVTSEPAVSPPTAGQTEEQPADTPADTDASTDTSAEKEDADADAGDADTGDSETEDKEEVSSEPDNKMSDGITIPEIKQPKLNVPDSDAMAFVNAMGIGYNLGNTFDAYIDPLPGDELSAETCWQNPKTTQQMIKDIHAYGYDTIRIPVSWHNHVDDDINISAQWLDRVNEVVDWAIDEDMYVIINIHHDNHEEAKGLYPDKAHLDHSKKYVGRIWEQLSERFKDYDDHLIFESMNEPRLVGTDHEWDFAASYGDCREAVECINELNQVFVDTVRASGGNNASRYLMVPGYAASMDGGTNPFFEFPVDADGNESKIILSIHAYTPYNFALEYPGVSDFDIDNKDRTTDINSFMNKLYMDYVTQGIPVVIGEFGSRDKNGNLQDRVNYSAYYAAMSRARNIPCVLWDNNLFSGEGELFGVYDRKNPDDSLTDIIYALMEYK